MSALERPKTCLATAVALFAAIFVLRLIAPAAGDGVTLLYVLPIVVVAIGLGTRAGLVAAALAFSLSTAWVLLAGIPISALGYVVRVAVFAFVAGLVGRFAADLRAAEADSARHFNLSMDMICIAGFDGFFKEVNPAFERILGYRREDLVGRPFLAFVHPDDRERTEREAAALAEGHTTVQFENRYFDSDGRVHWLEWASVPLLDEQIIYGVARDITDRKQLDQELKRLSQRDPLTGAFNRRRFDEELGNRLLDARRYERRGALLLADLDRLKRINDELGHGAGDLALCEVARLFDENLRRGDLVGRDAEGIVARLGGDEFAILLTEVDEEEAEAIAGRLVAALEMTDLRVEGRRVRLSISIGVAAFEGGPALDAGTLVAAADRALYTVKASGGGAAARAPVLRRELGPEPAQRLL